MSWSEWPLQAAWDQTAVPKSAVELGREGLKVEDRRELDRTIMPEEDGMRGSPWSPMSYGRL